MAGPADSAFPLTSLEDDLTCSICLSPFDCPVTIPCGHNFCQDCLLETWTWRESSHCCPQCRTVFATKPELRKNTALSSLVETLNLRSSKMSEASRTAEESQAGSGDVIRCDTCMQAEASRTCLTCMASYCEEHLRPHLENPVFRLHQLSAPVGDLSDHICPDHHRLMEFFCSQHDLTICSICLQQVHKGCTFTSPEEQRVVKNSDLRGKLGLLDGKITINEDVVYQMKDIQSKLTDSATNRRKALAVEYQQMSDMLARDERDALNAVDRELESGQTKLKDIMMKFTDNIDALSKAKEQVQSLLSQSHTLAFLQVSFDLPPAIKNNPFVPKIKLDSKNIQATEASAAALKEYLTKILKQPVEGRLLTLKTDLNTDSNESEEKANLVSGSAGSHQTESTQPKKQRRKPRSHSPGGPLFQPFCVPPSYIGPMEGWNPFRYPYGDQPISAPGFVPPPHRIYQNPGSQPKAGTKMPPQDKMGSKDHFASKEYQLNINEKDKPRGRSPVQSKEKPDITSAEKRSELLKYGAVLTLDPRTAHKRITLTEGYTKASVSDEQVDYQHSPLRFAVCSQVLASQGFSQGRHYWEVRLSSNDFIGVGLCYNSIDRKGLTSRLGRNTDSWCVEWLNGKLSAWYNSCETVLDNPNPKRVGVLLDCDGGTATFYNVADRAYPFHCFVFPFAQVVYPAFWIFSSGLSITLCKLQI